MRNLRKALLRFTALGLLPFCITTVASAQNAEQIAQKALAATVYLEMTDRNDQILGFGSGFFVGQNQIATNFHVIEGAAKGTAKLVGKSTKYTIEGISATDEKNDLAILKVTAFGVAPLLFGDSNVVKIGETVYVAGNPKGLEGTFSNGIISSLREGYAKKRLQMTAPISPGSSGGPVLNGKGKVIGVSFMTLEGGQNLNFAIPSNYLKELMARSGGAKLLSQGEQSISAETYLIWGHTKYDLGLYQGAIAAYDKAIRLKPDYAYAYITRGDAKAQLDQYFGAIADFDTAIRLKPDYANAYVSRGLTKSLLGQHAAAIADHDTAIQLKPDYANAYVGRGSAKSFLGQHAAAITDYDTAIQLKPDYADAYAGRGDMKADLGQYLAAIADFDTTIRLKPDHIFAYAKRGLAKGTLGRTWEAKQDLRTALKLAKQAGDESLKTYIESLLRDLN